MIKKSPKSHEQEIRKKLSNIRDLKQLQKLLIKVDDQNKNLVKDIKLFKDKIDELLEKQNSGNSGNKERQERDKI